MRGVLLPANPAQPPRSLSLDPDKTALLTSISASTRGVCQAIVLPQPAARIFAYREDPRLPVNSLASLIVRAADPARRQDRIRGDALLVGAAHGDGHESAPAAYTDILLDWNGLFRVEFQPVQGGPRLPLSWPEWPEVTAAYRQGLLLGRALPRMAVCVVRAP
ncbi:hypothetical protein [Frankia sp. AgPm24]|uniref:hypothetical protein n=1 Tax=Frankia sp. AgPm24 TaxID=631128 RepID=UPI00200DAB2C|nr:hypothetical protein [Frankia sp. AgPm24]